VDTEASSVCRVCLASTWQDQRAADAASRACEPCPSNSRGVETGAVSVATCVCDDGFRFADGSLLPDGSPDADAYGCALCDAGSFCPGSGVSTTCPRNHWSYAGVNAGPCAECAPRSYALQEAGMRGPELCQCVQGAQGIADSGCGLCAPGSFQPCDFSLRRNHAGTHCAGELSGLGVLAVARPVACAPCAADTYSDAHGAVACSACPGNSSSGPGSIDRTGCRCDCSFFGADSDECAVCPLDSHCTGGLNYPCRLYSSSLAGSDSEEDCACREGYYSLSASGACLKCLAGSYCPGGQTVNLCAGNSSSATGSSLIEQCLCWPGTWRGCVAGQSAAGACTVDYSRGCLHCAAGDICFNNTLVHCPEHRTSGVGSDEGADCKCNNGYYNVLTHSHDAEDADGHTHR